MCLASLTTNANIPGTRRTLKNVDPTTDPRPMSSLTKKTPENKIHVVSDLPVSVHYVYGNNGIYDPKVLSAELGPRLVALV